MISSESASDYIRSSLFTNSNRKNVYSITDFVPTKSMLAKINPISPELNTLAILSG